MKTILQTLYIIGFILVNTFVIQSIVESRGISVATSIAVFTAVIVCSIAYIIVAFAINGLVEQIKHRLL